MKMKNRLRLSFEKNYIQVVESYQNYSQAAAAKKEAKVTKTAPVTPNASRVGAVHKCTICGDEKEKSGYSGPQWRKNRKKGTAKCLLCKNIVIHGAPTLVVHKCAICGDEKEKSGYNGSQWKNNREKGTAKCLLCVAK